jgi:hypothetical protein
MISRAGNFNLPAPFGRQAELNDWPVRQRLGEYEEKR